MRRTFAITLTAVAWLAGLASLGALDAAASGYTPSSYSSRLVQLINETRGQHGLRALTVTTGTSEVAASWTGHLASTKTLAHNPDLQSELESHGSSNWTTYGENVGEASASSPDTLFNAYMQSPEHRANVLSSAYRYVGVGDVFTGSTAWNTLDFVDAYGWTSSSRTKSSPTRTTATSRPGTARPTTSRHTMTQRPARHATASHRAARPLTRPAIHALPLPSPSAAKVAAVAALQESANPLANGWESRDAPIRLSGEPSGSIQRALAVAVASLAVFGGLMAWVPAVRRRG